MKIIHCSDLHFGKKPNGTKKFSETRFEDFFRAFDSLIEKISGLQVDIFLISGDFFDKKEINANILEKTEALLQKLKQQKPELRIITIEGNHDVIQKEEDSWLEYLSKKGYMEVFSYRKDFIGKNSFQIEDLHFYPVGYPGFMVEEALQELAERLDEKQKNIVMVHTGLSGSDTLPGLVSPKILDLFQGKVLYIAAGHIHSFTSYPKENPYFFVPGSLEFTNIPNEKSNQKGAIYFDTETKEYEWIEVEARKRIRGAVFSYQQDLEEELKTYLQDYSLTGEEMILIPIKNERQEYINVDSLEKIAEGQGALKAFFDIQMRNHFEGNAWKKEYLDLDELEKFFIKDWKEVKSCEALAENFSLLKNLYQNGEEEDFIKVFDKILGGQEE